MWHTYGDAMFFSRSLLREARSIVMASIHRIPPSKFAFLQRHQLRRYCWALGLPWNGNSSPAAMVTTIVNFREATGARQEPVQQAPASQPTAPAPTSAPSAPTPATILHTQKETALQGAVRELIPAITAVKEDLRKLSEFLKIQRPSPTLVPANPSTASKATSFVAPPLQEAFNKPPHDAVQPPTTIPASPPALHLTTMSYEKIISAGKGTLLRLSRSNLHSSADNLSDLEEEDLLLLVLSLWRKLHDEDEGCKVSGGVQPSSPTSSPISLPTTTPSITCTTAFHPAVSSVLPPSNDAFILPFQPIPHQVEKSRPPPAPNWLRRPSPAPNWPRRFQILHNKYLHWIKQIFCAEETYWRGRPSHLSKMDWMASLIIYLDAIVFGQFNWRNFILLSLWWNSILFFGWMHDEQMYFPWLRFCRSNSSSIVETWGGYRILPLYVIASVVH
jgi:hypothetical protein